MMVAGSFYAALIIFNFHRVWMQTRRCSPQLFYVGSFISVPFMVIYFTIIFFPFEM